MALRMFSSPIPAPITMMRKPGRAAFRVATTSNKFEPIWVPRSTRSMVCCVPASDKEVELNSKSDSEPRQARNPTNRKGSLSITATRMGCFLRGEALIKAPYSTVILAHPGGRRFGTKGHVAFKYQSHGLQSATRTLLFRLPITCDNGDF